MIKKIMFEGYSKMLEFASITSFCVLICYIHYGYGLELMEDANMTDFNAWTTSGKWLCSTCSLMSDVGPYVDGGYYLYVEAGDSQQEVTLTGFAYVSADINNATLGIHYYTQFAKQFEVSVSFYSYGRHWNSYTMQPGFGILSTTVTFPSSSDSRRAPLTIEITTSSGPGDVLSINRVSLWSDVEETTTLSSEVVVFIILGIICGIVVFMAIFATLYSRFSGSKNDPKG